MVLISTPDDAQSMPSKPLSELLPNTPAKLDNDVYALIADFFENYKHLKGKTVEIIGWEDAAAAKAEIKRAYAAEQTKR